MPLREEKRLRTREALLDAAVALFAERGYDATTVDDIAERAVVSRATAFKYFPRKEDLLLEWAARRRGVIAELWRQPSDEHVDPARIKELIRALAAIYVRERAGRALIDAWLTTGGPLKPEAWVSARLLADLVRAGQAAGTINPGIDASVTGRMLLNVFLGALYQWAAERRSGTWLRREIDTALDVLISGIGAAPTG